MPASPSYTERLYPQLEKLADHYGTPFHIYDEAGIRATGERLKKVFADIEGFREYFAVKALPNPSILKIMQEMGFGFDCSSITELELCRSIGANGDDIMFTSNNTSGQDFTVAGADGGCLLNLDDVTLVEKVPEMPECICFRYNPGNKRTGNTIIGTPTEAKYGLTDEQLVTAYGQAKERGATRFGLHTMLASNELNYTYMVKTAAMLLEQVERLSTELGISFDFINIGGGLGIPYLPDAQTLDLEAMGAEITALFAEFKAKHGSVPALFMESGRFMTGPHGVLVTRAINKKDIYRSYVGVDACMSALMRPGMYEAYHHIDVVGKNVPAETKVVDVVGSLCENNDKFAVQRELPLVTEGDFIVIHDTGAHGHAMGFNYNGSLRPKELLFTIDGGAELIRRAEQPADLFATLNFEKDHLAL